MRKRIEEAEARLAYDVPERVRKFVIALKAEIASRQAEIDEKRSELHAAEARKAAEKAKGRVERQLKKIGLDNVSPDLLEGLKADMLKRELGGGPAATEEPAAPKRGRGRPRKDSTDRPQPTEEEEAEYAREEQALADIMAATSDEVLLAELPERVDMLFRLGVAPLASAAVAAVTSPPVSALSARAPEPEPVIPAEEAPASEVAALDAAEDLQAASDIEATPADQGEAVPVAAPEDGAEDEAEIEPADPEPPAAQEIPQRNAVEEAQTDQDQPAEAVAEPAPTPVPVEGLAPTDEPAPLPVTAEDDPAPAGETISAPVETPPTLPEEPRAHVDEYAARREVAARDPLIVRLTSLLVEMEAYEASLKGRPGSANLGVTCTMRKNEVGRIRASSLKAVLDERPRPVPRLHIDIGKWDRFLKHSEAPLGSTFAEARARIRSRLMDVLDSP